MIYVCVPTRNNAKTVGLLLWKVRQVLAEFPREFQLLVANDGSDDATAEVLESYGHVLPLSVTTAPAPRGYAATVEELLRSALRHSDRPKRDCAIVVNGDFSVSPGVLPDLIRAVESGADLVVGEVPPAHQPFARRLLQRASAWLLRPGLQLPGVEDLLSGVYAIRLVTLKRCLRDGDGALLQTDGVPARAELLARAAACARQITALPIDTTYLRNGGVPGGTLHLALQLFRAGRAVNIPRPEAAVRRTS